MFAAIEVAGGVSVVLVAVITSAAGVIEAIRRTRKVERQVQTGNGKTIGEYGVHISDRIDHLVVLMSESKLSREQLRDNQQLIHERLADVDGDVKDLLVSFQEHVASDEGNFKLLHDDLVAMQRDANVRSNIIIPKGTDR